MALSTASLLFKESFYHSSNLTQAMEAGVSCLLIFPSLRLVQPILPARARDSWLLFWFCRSQIPLKAEAEALPLVHCVLSSFRVLSDFNHSGVVGAGTGPPCLVAGKDGASVPSMCSSALPAETPSPPVPRWSPDSKEEGLSHHLQSLLQGR